MTLSGDSTDAEPSRPTGRLPRNVWVLGVASLLNDVASEAIFPLLPSVIGRMGGGLWLIGLIEGLADSAASLLKLFSGAWSDRMATRRGWVIGGYSVTALIRPVVALATSPWQILGVRLIDRMGKGIRTSPRDALLVDSTPAEQVGRAFGFHRAMDHLGAALGPALAFGFLACLPGAYRTLFALTLIPGLAVLAVLFWGLVETPRRAAVKQTELPRLSAFPAVFRRYLLVVALFTLANSSDAFLLIRAEQLGVEVAYLPILWFVFHVAKSIGNVIGGGWVDRWGPRRVLAAGWGAYALVYLAWGLAQTAPQAWGLMLLYAGYFACAEPAEKALVATLVPADRKGQAFGWFHFTVGLAALPASLLFGAIYGRLGATPAFCLGAAVAGVSALAIVLLVPSTARSTL